MILFASRIAVAFGPTRHECRNVSDELSRVKRFAKRMSFLRGSTAARKYPSLTPNQAALKLTALSIAVEVVDDMEPLFGKGKKDESDWQ